MLTTLKALTLKLLCLACLFTASSAQAAVTISDAWVRENAPGQVVGAAGQLCIDSAVVDNGLRAAAGFAGLVSGPNTLKIVGTPSSRRGTPA